MTQILFELANRSPTARETTASTGAADDGAFAGRLQDAAADAAGESSDSAASSIPSQERPAADETEAADRAPTAADPAAPEAEAARDGDELLEPVETAEEETVDVVAVVIPELVESFDTLPEDANLEAPVAEAIAETIVVDPVAEAAGVADGAAGPIVGGEGASAESAEEVAPLLPLRRSGEQGNDRQSPREADSEQSTRGVRGVDAPATAADDLPNESQGDDLPQQAEQPGLEAGAQAEGERQQASSIVGEQDGTAANGQANRDREADRPNTDALNNAGTPVGGVSEESSTSAVSAEVVEPVAEPDAAEAVPRTDPAPNAADRPVAAGETDLSRIAAGRIDRFSNAEGSEETGPRVDAARFVSRVSGAFRAAEERGGEVRLRLSPPELGVLQVKLTVSEGVLNATLETENAAARNAILDNLPALRERLAEQEIRIEKFDVDVRDESGGRDDQDYTPGERRKEQGDRRSKSQENRTAGGETNGGSRQPTQTIGRGSINVVA